MSARVLIAEDNEQIAASIESMLRTQGYQVERTADGVAALGRLVAAPFDLLLLDLKLPGLHGIELLKKLRQSPRTSRLPVVVITGVYRGEQYAAGARALGVNIYLEKPFRAADLLAAVQKSLAAPTAAATPAAPSATPTTPLSGGQRPAAAPATPQAPVSPAPAEAPTGLDRHLLKAFLSRYSGRCLLRGAGAERELVFIGGTPVSLRPGYVHKDFGEFLLRQGVFKEAEHAAYIRAGEYRHDLPVQMGCLSYPDLLQAKLAYLTSELVAGLATAPTNAELVPLDLPPGLQVVSVNVPQILYQAYHNAHRPERSRRLLEQAGRRFVATASGYYQFINLLLLNSEERFALARLDGRRTLQEALEGKDHLIPMIQTLQAFGMIRLAAAPLAPEPPPPWPIRTLFNAASIEPEEPTFEASEESLEKFSDLVAAAAVPGTPAPAPPPPVQAAPAQPSSLAEKVRTTLDGMKGKNHYEVFGLTQGNFSFERLKERYFAITREYGPDVLMQLGGGEAGMVEEILSTVATAYNTLSDVVKKESYDALLGSDKIGLGHKGDDLFQAEVQSQSGKVFIEMEEWDNAEKSLQDACNIAPNNGDFLAHLAWSIYRNPKNANSRAMLDKARQMLNRSLTLDRTAAGFAFKGHMLLDSGQDSLAEAEFNKALKLDARNMLARKGMRVIQEKQDQQKKGLFGRMFR